MHPKDIKAQIRKQLKNKYPNCNRLKLLGIEDRGMFPDGYRRRFALDYSGQSNRPL
ncbi:MAG: hypothetical protein LWX52_11970 [Deltaproteobacteria bacterium]|nr:hypothetical protein [Deltaproteobacteria bacterium]